MLYKGIHIHHSSSRIGGNNDHRCKYKASNEQWANAMYNGGCLHNHSLNIQDQFSLFRNSFLSHFNDMSIVLLERFMYKNRFKISVHT